MARAFNPSTQWVETGSDKVGWRQDLGPLGQRKETGRKQLVTAPSFLIFQLFTLISDSRADSLIKVNASHIKN